MIPASYLRWLCNEMRSVPYERSALNPSCSNISFLCCRTLHSLHSDVVKAEELFAFSPPSFPPPRFCFQDFHDYTTLGVP